MRKERLLRLLDAIRQIQHALLTYLARCLILSRGVCKSKRACGTCGTRREQRFGGASFTQQRRRELFAQLALARIERSLTQRCSARIASAHERPSVSQRT